MFFIGPINGTLFTMTFQSKKLRDVGCELYLFALSIFSLISTIIFTLKFCLFILSQISWITNRNVLLINCISVDFILKLFPPIGDWLGACVAIERLCVVTKGVGFNIQKSQQAVRWIIVGIVLFTISSLVYDPIHRQLIDDRGEGRI